jgi:hypothetical protein
LQKNVILDRRAALGLRRIWRGWFGGLISHCHGVSSLL